MSFPRWIPLISMLAAACLASGFAQTSASIAPSISPSRPPSSQPPKVLFAGPPRIAKVEVYGNAKLAKAKLLQIAGIAEGEALTVSRRDVEDRLEKDSEIIEAHVEGHCCLGNDIVLYVGIVENGATPFALHSPPSEDIGLPTKLDLVYQRLVRALEAAHERGATGETYERGYPLSEDPEARRSQETFPLIIDPYVEDLGQILRRAADEPVRAAAAYLLAFTSKKAEAEEHLQYALRDFDPDVRLNALRSLDLIRLALAALPPNGEEPPKRVSPTWLIEMLNSTSFQDRLEASRLLVRLVPAGDEKGLLQIEERALVALVEMAQWKIPDHASAAYTLLGRVAGVSGGEIRSSFESGRRETVLQAIRDKVKSKKRFLVF